MRWSGFGVVALLVLLLGAVIGSALLLSPPPPAAPAPSLPVETPPPRRTRRPPPPIPAPLPAAVEGRVAGGSIGAGAWVALTGASCDLRVPLEAGGAFVFPEAPSGVPLTLWLGPDTDGTSLARLAKDLRLAPGERRRLDLAAPVKAALQGRVTGPGGAPVRGAKVAALDPRADWREQVPVAAVTGADGVFFVGFSPHDRPGPLRLVVDAVAQGFCLEERIVEVDPDYGPVAETIALTPGLRIGGRVFGPGDVPVPGAEVHILEKHPGDPMERRPVEGRVRTDPEGRFVDGAYRPGVYRVCVDGVQGGVRIAAVADPVTAGDEGVELRVRGFGRLRLEFVSAETREPLTLDGGSLEFVFGHTGEEEEFAEWVDLSGRSAAEAERLPEGHYRVTAWCGDREELFSDLFFVAAGKDLGLLRFELAAR
jgi:hypothetical protein